ncbi:hypothetical protein M407DRAFT_229898 [Tulasnella calospora MUT 4182]|uniref:Uncharacterized protein n=1 Tax=Tulasnella calospora MUT 4182 TaxID=1051891 RepID=A0A0C3PQY0_9AGAM|nr:hypothetical protein M407DRAFT_229898 [Tulasnella calospora MUT 4182]
MRQTELLAGNPTSVRFLQPKRVPGLYKALLGKSRATTGFEAWAEDKDVKAKIEEEINKELTEMGYIVPSKARNQAAIGIRRRVLSTRFKKLSEEDRRAWGEVAKTGLKPGARDSMVMVDNAFDFSIDMYSRLAVDAGMRVVLLAAGRGESGFPILVQEFSPSFKKGQFLATSLGRRIKREWGEFVKEVFTGK